MPIRKEYPAVFNPSGLTDAADETLSFAGACTDLVNLIPSQYNPYSFVPRPGVTKINASSVGGHIRGMVVVGDYVYGYYYNEVTFRDEPFAYGLGATAATLTKAADETGFDGAYYNVVPITFTVVGKYLLSTHFGGANYTLNVTGSINADILTITAVGGTSAVREGQQITYGGAVLTNIYVKTQLTGTKGGIGTYQLNQTVGVVAPGTVFTHVGSGTTGYIGVFDISKPSAPYFFSTNMGGVPFQGGVFGGFPWLDTPSQTPTGVANFNNRAYYSFGNTVYFSDVLLPLYMTSATQSLTIGDNTPIIGIGGLPVQTSTSGVVASLQIFKEFQIWQVTGDSASSTLAVNYLSLNIGTAHPYTIVQTPQGLVFLSTDGVYVVTQSGQVVPLTKDFGSPTQDLQYPFINVVKVDREVSPARACFSGSVYRICLNILVGISTLARDYWFDTVSRRWSGSHTYAYDQCQPYKSYFVISDTRYSPSGGDKGIMYKSPIYPDPNTVYTDTNRFGTVSFLCSFQTTQFTKSGALEVKQLVRSNVEFGCGKAVVNSYQIQAYSESGQILDTISVSTPTVGTNCRQTLPLNWTKPLVFTKVTFYITVTSSSSVEIGAITLRLADTNYATL